MYGNSDDSSYLTSFNSNAKNKCDHYISIMALNNIQIKIDSNNQNNQTKKIKTEENATTMNTKTIATNETATTITTTNDKTKTTAIATKETETINSIWYSNTERIFFEVWKNKILRNLIFSHLRLLNQINQHPYYIITRNLDSFSFKYADDLDSVEFLGSFKRDYKEEPILSIMPGVIPQNVKNIKFAYTGTRTVLKVGSIPESCTSIIIQKPHQEYTYGIFHNNITTIKLCNLNQKLNCNWLPKSLTSLTLDGSFDKDILEGQLPSSLIHLNLHCNYNGVIEEGAIPKGCKSLHYTFDSNNNSIEYNSSNIPPSVTNIKFDDTFNQPIYSISANVREMEFGKDYDIENIISDSSDETSIRKLVFSEEYKLIEDSYGWFPEGVTFVDMGGMDFDFSSDLFPYSIKSIKFSWLRFQIPSGYFKYQKLTELDLGDYDKEIPVNTLSHSLISLKWSNGLNSLRKGVLPNGLQVLQMDEFDEEIPPNSLPNSLKTLSINSFDYQLHLGSLPSSITNLSINRYAQQITNETLPSSVVTVSINAFTGTLQSGCLPKTLKYLSITNCSYYLDNLDELFESVESFCNLTVSIYNNTLLNSLTDEFIRNFIILYHNYN